MKKATLASLLTDVPGWVPALADVLVVQAEDLFDDGATKEEWVISALRAALKLHDISWLPDVIEEALEHQAVKAIVHLVFSIKFRADPNKRFVRKMRRAEKLIEKGKLPPGSYWNETFKRYSQSDIEESHYNPGTSFELWAKYRGARAY